MHNSQKGFAPIIFILGILVISAAIIIGALYIKNASQNRVLNPVKQGKRIASSTDNQNVLKIWDDGTAYVKGEVIEHISGCEVDGTCKLILDVNDQRVALVYGEGHFGCLNAQAASWVHWGQNVKSGTKVKAYGAYRKMDNEYELTFCDSKDYFILGENDPVPVGAYTEKFFDEAVKGKGEAQ